MALDPTGVLQQQEHNVTQPPEMADPGLHQLSHRLEILQDNTAFKSVLDGTVSVFSSRPVTSLPVAAAAVC